MRRKNIITKFLIFILALVFIMPSGYIAYSMISDQMASPAEEESVEQQQVTAAQQAVAPQLESVEVSPEIRELIRQSDPTNFDKNLMNYMTLLSKLDVHRDFQNEMEKLLQDGHKLPDILIGYDFLNDNFGRVQDIETLILEKESAGGWRSVFEGYDRLNPEFVPGSFEPEYLEKLMNTPGITSDDIMIADRVAQKLSLPVSEVINRRIAGGTWKDINASYGIINAQSEIPHVPVTPEQIDRYTAGGMERQEVILAFVIAMKMDKSPKEVIDKMKSGETREQVVADYYSQKYY